jgi:hypothetical protein
LKVQQATAHGRETSQVGHVSGDLRASQLVVDTNAAHPNGEAILGRTYVDIQGPKELFRETRPLDRVGSSLKERERERTVERT